MGFLDALTLGFGLGFLPPTGQRIYSGEGLLGDAKVLRGDWLRVQRIVSEDARFRRRFDKKHELVSSQRAA
jgi:hypothetical protein